MFVLAASAAAAAIACGGPPVPTPAQVEDSATAATRAAINAAWARHIAGALQRDLAAISEMYAPTAVYSASGVEVRGRPALDSLEARTLRLMTVIDATHTMRDLQVAGDIAYEIGSIVGPVQPKGDSTRVLTFHFMAQWRRQPDGDWRLTYLVGQ